MERSDEFLMGGTRTMNLACVDFGQALGELGIDDAALLGRIFVVCRERLGMDANGRKP